MILTVDNPLVVAFLKAWQDNDLKCGNLHHADAEWHEKYTNEQKKKTAKERKKFLALDNGTSGHFLVDRKTHIVYSIKGYGVPNYKKSRGTIEFLTRFIEQCTEKGEEYTHQYWYALHPTE